MQLYTYFRSSAAYRVRIALNLKGLSAEMVPIHLQKEGGLDKKPEYRAVNPQMRVPALRLDSGELLTQSLAIIEYLDEVHREPPLLPRDPVERAKVRALAGADRLRHPPAQQHIASCCAISRTSLGRTKPRSIAGIITGIPRASTQWKPWFVRRPTRSAARSRSPIFVSCRRSTTRGV